MTVCWSSALLQTASLKRGSTEACTDTDVVMLSDIICSEGEFRLSLKFCLFKCACAWCHQHYWMYSMYTGSDCMGTFLFLLTPQDGDKEGILLTACSFWSLNSFYYYWHEYYWSLISSTTSYQFLMDVYILHKHLTLCVGHTVCQAPWETHHCCVTSSDTSSVKPSQKHHSDCNLSF